METFPSTLPCRNFQHTFSLNSIPVFFFHYNLMIYRSLVRLLSLFIPFLCRSYDYYDHCFLTSNYCAIFTYYQVYYPIIIESSAIFPAPCAMPPLPQALHAAVMPSTAPSTALGCTASRARACGQRRRRSQALIAWWEKSMAILGSDLLEVPTRYNKAYVRPM